MFQTEMSSAIPIENLLLITLTLLYPFGAHELRISVDTHVHALIPDSRSI